MKTQKKDLTTAAYEKGIQDYLKEVAESGSDVHENYTPAEICDMMLDKVDLAKAETVLVLYNIELLFALKKRKFSGHVTFFTQSEEKAGLAPKIFSNITVEYIDKEANPLYHMENKWPDKFDIVIANPPYSRKLDLKFLDRAFDVAKEEIVFVHPASTFIDVKKSTSAFKKINSKIEKYIKSLTLFNGNGIFGISLFVPCSVTYINKSISKKGFHLIDMVNSKNSFCNSIDDISVHGNVNEFRTIKEKVLTSNNLQSNGTVLGSRGKDQRILSNPNAKFVEMSRIQGSPNKGNLGMDSPIHTKQSFVILNGPALTVKSGRNPEYNIWWEFETEIEAKNFITYCKTYFARFCISIYKFAQSLDNGELRAVPWMDFTQEWTDKKLYAHFNITEKEQAFIKEIIPPYYD